MKQTPNLPPQDDTRETENEKGMNIKIYTKQKYDLKPERAGTRCTHGQRSGKDETILTCEGEKEHPE